MIQNFIRQLSIVRTKFKLHSFFKKHVKNVIGNLRFSIKSKCHQSGVGLICENKLLHSHFRRIGSQFLHPLRSWFRQRARALFIIQKAVNPGWMCTGIKFAAKELRERLHECDIDVRFEHTCCRCGCQKERWSVLVSDCSQCYETLKWSDVLESIENLLMDAELFGRFLFVRKTPTAHGFFSDNHILCGGHAHFGDLLLEQQDGCTIGGCFSPAQVNSRMCDNECKWTSMIDVRDCFNFGMDRVIRLDGAVSVASLRYVDDFFQASRVFCRDCLVERVECVHNHSLVWTHSAHSYSVKWLDLAIDYDVNCGAISVGPWLYEREFVLGHCHSREKRSLREYIIPELVDYMELHGIVQGKMSRFSQIECSQQMLVRAITNELVMWIRLSFPRLLILKLWSHSRKYASVAKVARVVIGILHKDGWFTRRQPLGPGSDQP